MEVSRFVSELKFVNQIGQTLNIDERMRLELALLTLSGNYSFDSFFFWGRLEGIERDYYIAMGVQYKGEFEFPKKKFFWCSSSNFNFSELPPYNPEFVRRAELLREPFTGQHERIVFKKEIYDDQIDFEDSLEIPAQLPMKSFSELERLSYVVNTIEHLCALVPIGAYKLTPTHELLIDENFKGIQQNNLTNPNLYQHFRNPLSIEKKEFIARDDALFKPDFLDPVTIDYPNQQWSIQTDSTKQNVTIRNLLWPGFVAYHRANTNIFGYAYFGDGIRNSDLEFLI